MFNSIMFDIILHEQETLISCRINMREEDYTNIVYFPTITVLDWLSVSSSHEVTPVHDTPGEKAILSWKLPISLAEFLKDRFKNIPKANVTRLEKYLDIISRKE
jgi:hypothetical protein